MLGHSVGESDESASAEDQQKILRLEGAADVVAEVAAARITERGATRADDRISEAGMEDRKKEGYF